MPNVFSHPAFVPTGGYTLAGYNLLKSAAVNGGPSYFGPWVPVTAYTNYTKNTDIVDMTGSFWDLYQVQPIIQVTLPDGSTPSIELTPSRPFFASQNLYDVQVSVLLEHFRNNWLNDAGIPQTESTVITETNGGNIMPFITDPATTRFYLSFLPNDDPVKLIADTVQVYLGADKASAVPLVPYTDFFPSEEGGFIDFAVIPPTGSYCRVEFKKVKYTNDQCRSALLNAVSTLSLFGINGYQVNTSNNLNYLAVSLPDRDLGDILCGFAFKSLLNSEFLSQLTGAESWKDGQVEWSADPGRALQAAAGRVADLEEELRRRCNVYILNTRQYISRGEFDSYFDVSGVLPIYTLIVAGANFAGAMGWWL
jgi:hypothetical protein